MSGSNPGQPPRQPGPPPQVPPPQQRPSHWGPPPGGPPPGMAGGRPPGPPPGWGPAPPGWGAPPPGRPAARGNRLLLVFGGLFLLLVVIGAGAILALAPGDPPVECPPPQQICGGPPEPPTPAPGLPTAGPTQGASVPTPAPTGVPTPAPTGSPVAPSPIASPGVSPGPSPTPPPVGSLPQPVLPDESSPRLRTWSVYRHPQGVEVEHPPTLTPRELESGAVVVAAGIPARGVEVHVRFDVLPSSLAPTQAIEQLVESYRGNITALAPDDSPETRVHNPSIGHVPAEARVFRGTLSNAGSVVPVALAVLAANDGRVTVAVTVLSMNPDELFGSQTWYRGAGTLADDMLKRFTWRTGQ